MYLISLNFRGIFSYTLWLFFFDSTQFFGWPSKLHGFLASSLKLFCWTGLYYANRYLWFAKYILLYLNRNTMLKTSKKNFCELSTQTFFRFVDCYTADMLAQCRCLADWATILYYSPGSRLTALIFTARLQYHFAKFIHEKQQFFFKAHFF